MVEVTSSAAAASLPAVHRTTNGRGPLSTACRVNLRALPADTIDGPPLWPRTRGIGCPRHADAQGDPRDRRSRGHRSRTRRRSTSPTRATRSSTSSTTTWRSPTARWPGIRGRPMALKRFVDGITKEPFFQKRAPDNTPDWIRTAELTFPSGRTADEIVVDDAAGLAWIINLGCIDLNPHPVRADDLDHPDELRVDLDPVPGVQWPQIRDVAMVCKEALEAVGLVGWPKTSGSRGIHINVRIERDWTYPEVRRAALALARDVERRAPDAATCKWWKEERHGVFLDYNQNAKDRTVASAYSIRPLPDARVSTPLTWDEVPTVEAEAFTIETVPARFAEIGDPGAGIDDAVGSLEALAGAVRASTRRRARATPRGHRTTPSRPASRRASSRRRKRRPETEYEPGRGEAGGPPPEVAAERAAAVAAGDPNAGLPTEWEGSRPTPTGRRKTSIPVIEISRAASKAEALEGLERWKARHPEGGGRPRAGRRPGRRHARALVALVPGPGQPDPRPGARAPGPGSRSIRTTTRGPVRTSRPGRPDRPHADPDRSPVDGHIAKRDRRRSANPKAAATASTPPKTSKPPKATTTKASKPPGYVTRAASRTSFVSGGRLGER